MIIKFKEQEQKNPTTFSIFYQLLASLTIVIIGLQAQLIKRVPTTQFLIYRNVLQLVFCMALQTIFKDKQSYYFSDRSVSIKVYLKVIVGAINGILYYKALVLISLSEFVILSRTTPLWTAIIMIYILKKLKLTLSLVIQIVLCAIGLILVAKPTFIHSLFDLNHNDASSSQNLDLSHHTQGVILLTVAAFILAIAQILMREIGDEVSSVVIVNYQAIGSILMSAVSQIVEGNAVIVTVYEIWMIALMGALGLLTQVLITKAFQIGNVTQLSLVANAQIIFAILIDYFVFSYHIDTLSIIGTITIFTSFMFIGVNK